MCPAPLTNKDPVISMPFIFVVNFRLPAEYSPVQDSSELVFKRRSLFLSTTLKLILLPPLLIVRGWGVDESLSIVIKGRLPACS